MKGNGWIKLYRLIEQSNVWKKPSDWLKIWLYLLLGVNHNNGEGFFTWEQIEQDCHISKKQLRRFFNFAVSEKMIIREKTTRGIRICILNWKIYQHELRAHTEGTSEGTTEGTSNTSQKPIIKANKERFNFLEGTSEGTTEGTSKGPSDKQEEVLQEVKKKEKETDKKKSVNQPYQIFEYFYSKITARDKEPIPETMINKDRELKNAKLLLKKMPLEECKQFLDRVFACSSFYCSKANTLSYLYANLTNIYQEIKKGGKDGKYISVNSIERKGGEANAGEW
jgi:hypothetical protein